MKTIHYADIKENDIEDGEGICVSFWTQGCPFHCRNCHNPQTWEFQGGLTAPLSEVKSRILKAISANGVQRNFSILGGEPLAFKNIDIVETLIKAVKKQYPQIKIYIWTGFTFETLVEAINLENELNRKEKLKNILNNVDVLIDGQYKDELRDITLFLRGSKNQRVIDVQKTIKENKIVLYHN